MCTGKMIIVDERRCMACKQCVISCAIAHSEADGLVEAITGEAAAQERIYIESAGEFAVALQCRHCADPPCMAVCPSGAISRTSDTEPVLVDTEKCTGCGFCILACPFGVVEMSRSEKAVIKCDLCIRRTSEGELPACVAACPTGALEFVEADEELRRGRSAEFAAATRCTDAPAAGAADDTDPATVTCASCGKAFVRKRMFEFVRSKMPAGVELSPVCSACRRSGAAARVREASTSTPVGADAPGAGKRAT